MSTALYPKQVISVGGRTILSPNQIVCLVADTNYTILHLSDGSKKIVSYHLGKLEERLARCGTFVRANRSTIVNLDFMSDYTNEHICILEKQINFSRRRRDNILQTIAVRETNKKTSQKRI